MSSHSSASEPAPEDAPPAAARSQDSWDDVQLALGLRQRNAEALDVFLARYKQVFHHCIAQFEADLGRRADLFQELVVALYERLDRDSFDPQKGAFGTWVYRVAWCRCVDLKRKQTTRGHLAAVAIEDESLEPISPAADPSETAGEAEIGELVRTALRGLDNEERRLVELRFLTGQTLVQIAAELELSLETAKYRLKRATQHLRQRLAQQLESLEAPE